MRRKEREVNDREEILALLEKCDVCRIAINNDGYPYIVPLNFGLLADDTQIAFIFHSANEGHKLDLLKKDNRVGFELDCDHLLLTDLSRVGCTMKYASIIGKGHIEFLSNDEKKDALKELMAHYHPENTDFDETVMPHTSVYKLIVEELTCKVNK